MTPKPEVSLGPKTIFLLLLLLTYSHTLSLTIDEADYDQNQSADNLVLVSLTIGKEQKGDDQRWPLIDSSLDLLASKSAHYVLKQSIG